MADDLALLIPDLHHQFVISNTNMRNSCLEYTIIHFGKWQIWIKKGENLLSQSFKWQKNEKSIF